MQNLFFFFLIEEIKRPAKNKIFGEIEKRNLFFSYFSIGSDYYLLVFGKQNFERVPYPKFHIKIGMVEQLVCLTKH
jgi:hypothetical protein